MTPRPEADVLRVFVPGIVTNQLNGAQGWHWSRVAKERKEWRARTVTMVRSRRHEAPFVPTVPKRITFTAHVWSRFDDDSLPATMKSVRDGLIDAGLIHADGPTSGHVFEYKQIVDRQRRGVQIEARALVPDGAQ